MHRFFFKKKREKSYCKLAHVGDGHALQVFGTQRDVYEYTWLAYVNHFIMVLGVKFPTQRVVNFTPKFPHVKLHM